MWDSIERRAAVCGEYIVRTGCTVRACAEHFGMSKSTVHKDVTERLEKSDPALAERVRGVLGVNLRERHLRGGDATRRMYALRRERSAKHA
ncbi:MAG TPA: sporulation transcriptional regulator SpoIIID [Firmicutes bacterium]|nr:sporulation transcriptional regulator SpoIIID [Bacillota bacterium]